MLTNEELEDLKRLHTCPKCVKCGDPMTFASDSHEYICIRENCCSDVPVPEFVFPDARVLRLIEQYEELKFRMDGLER
jgi:hypothetical protein